MTDSPHPIKVLVIDDLADNRMLLRLDLEDEIPNIQVTEARDGEEGLRRMAEEDFTVVICDLMMPGIDGLGVLKKSREDPDKRETPFIFLSANKQKDAAEQVLKAGAIDFLTKPYELVELISKVKSLARMCYLNESLLASQKELKENNKMLHRLNQDKDEVLRIVSHDMRNPLSNILGLASLIKTDGVEDEAELMHIADLIEKSSSSLLHLVNSLLDVARVESGRIQFDKTRLDVNELIRNSVKSFDLLARRKNIDIQFDLAEGEVTAWLDGPKLDQVMGNLLSNAIKFTEPGGVITLSTRQPDAGTTEIIVSDTGIGIPKENMDGIFDKFGAHQRPGTRQEKGSGLGLSIVKRFVELQNGDLAITSAPGEGTTFTIRFKSDLYEDQPAVG